MTKVPLKTYHISKKLFINYLNEPTKNQKIQNQEKKSFFILHLSLTGSLTVRN